MPEKNKSKGLIILILVIAIFFGAYYGLFGGGEGISISCTEKTILGFQKVPPPLMSALQPQNCKVDYTTKIDDLIICKDTQVITFERGVVPCYKLKEHVGRKVEINVTFYDPSNNEVLGTDFKELEYK